MTGSLEDTIATALAGVGWTIDADSLSTRAVAEALRAASVVPAEPATHDTPLFEGTVADFVRRFDSLERPPLARMLDRIVVYAVAVVDGEAPAT